MNNMKQNVIHDFYFLNFSPGVGKWPWRGPLSRSHGMVNYLLIPGIFTLCIYHSSNAIRHVDHELVNILLRDSTPFLHEDPLQFHKILWTSRNSGSAQIVPDMFNWIEVWWLWWPRKNIYSQFLKSIFDQSWCVCRRIVMLQHPAMRKLMVLSMEVSDGLAVPLSIDSLCQNCESWSSTIPNCSPYMNRPTMALSRMKNEIRSKSFSSHSPNSCSTIISEQAETWLICPENLFKGCCTP